MATSTMTFLTGLFGILVKIAHTEIIRRELFWTPSRSKVERANAELLNSCIVAFTAGNLKPEMVSWLGESIARRSGVARETMLNHSQLRNDLSVRLLAGGLDSEAEEVLRSLERRSETRYRDEDVVYFKRLAGIRLISAALATGLTLASMQIFLTAPSIQADEVEVGLLVLAVAFIALLVVSRCSAWRDNREGAIDTLRAEEASEHLVDLDAEENEKAGFSFAAGPSSDQS